MRHRVKKNRFPDYLLKNLAVSVILYEKVTTTKAKAKAIKPFIDRIISRAKQKDQVSAYRYLKARLPDLLAVEKITKELVPKYEKRNSGYTRIIPSHNRSGDSAAMVMITLTS